MNIDREQLTKIAGTNGCSGNGDLISNGEPACKSRSSNRQGRLFAQAADAVLEHLLATLSRQLKASAAGLWLLSGGARRPCFKPCFYYGPANGRHAAGGSAEPYPPYGLARAALRNGLPTVCDDVAEEPRVGPDRGPLLAHGVRRVMAVPLLRAGRAVGLVCLFGMAAEPCGLKEMELAQALAQQLTLTIQLTRRAGQLQREAVREERRRLARELHDTLAQGFTGIIMQLEAAQEAMQSSAPQDVQGHLRQACALARQSLGESRRTVRALRSPTLLKGSLCTALEQLLREMTAGTRLHAEFRLEGRERPLLAEREEHLLRIGQEALTNTLRHARADRFEARLAFAPNEIWLLLRDNGRGFDLQDVNGGFGLKGMRERAEKIGARLIVWSLAKKGTVVCVAVPDGRVPATEV